MKREGLIDILSSIAVVVIGLAIGFIILLVSNASEAIPAFNTILTFGFSSMRNVGDVLLLATPIILTGLSVAFAFKTGLFNIGASGQFTIGGFVAIYIGVQSSLPPFPRILLAVIAAAVAGGLWGAIPGLLKAYRNVNEVISSIMTNYIAMFLVNFAIMNGLSIPTPWGSIRITEPIFDRGRGTTLRMPDDSVLPSLGLENIFNDGFRSSHINIGILIAIATAILIYVILEKTTFGYELKACGFNKDAAKYAGINQNRNIVYSMMICGALAGLGGALNYMVGTGLSMGTVDVLAPEGFMGISVAFLGLNNPIGIIFSGTLISYLFLGGTRMQVFGFSVELIEMVISIIIYFCAFVTIVRAFFASKNRANTLMKTEEESG